MISVNGQAYPDEANIIDDHFHNYEGVLGLADAPTATHFADVEHITPFHAVSGSNVFGTPIDTIGTADTPIRAGCKFFDCRRLSIVDVSNTGLFIIRLIWGTSVQTSAAAEAAGQYTDTWAQQPTANGNNKTQDSMITRRLCGIHQIWLAIKNVTNLASMDYVIAVHEYPAPSN